MASSLSFKLRCYPTKHQKELINKSIGVSRWCYNYGMSRWQELYNAGEKTGWMILKSELVKLKKTPEHSFLSGVCSSIPVYSLRHLDTAYKNFFNKRANKPVFKKKKDNQGSFTIQAQHCLIRDTKHISFAKIGDIKVRQKIPYESFSLQNATLSKKGKYFYISLALKVSKESYNKVHKLKDTSNFVLGIDLGIKSHLTLSSGVHINLPASLDKVTGKIVKESKKLSKKQHPRTKGSKAVKSKNYLKQSLKVCNLYHKKDNILSDYIHKTTSLLSNNYGTIVVEGLPVKNLLKNRKLSASIHRQSWNRFINTLKYKCELKGVTLITADRYYPSSKTCSRCGNIKKDMRLSDRVYNCTSCGLKIDRDLNASLNLKHLGGEATEVTPVEISSLLADLNKNHIAYEVAESGKILNY